MALTDEKIKQIREVDRENLKNMIDDAEAIRAQTFDRLLKEHDELVGRIRNLHAEKGDLMRSHMSKAELFEYAKDEIKKRREEALSHLREHLESCQKGHATPFHELAMKNMFAEGKAYRLPWLIISDKDIKTLVDGLPESGMSAAERDAKIAAIDEQIVEMTVKLNNGQ